MLIRGRLFLRGWASGNSTRASVVAYVVHCDVVDDRPVVDIRDMDVAHGLVIEDATAPPLSAKKPDTDVAEAVVYAAVESDVGTPITLVKSKQAVAPAPIARSPEETRLRRQYPRTGHPKVSVSGVSPISGGPNVAITRAKGLFVYRERRRGDPDGEDDLGRRRGWYSQHGRCQ